MRLSRQPRRRVPITRSQKAFAVGARGGVSRRLVPKPFGSSPKDDELLAEKGAGHRFTDPCGRASAGAGRYAAGSSMAELYTTTTLATGEGRTSRQKHWDPPSRTDFLRLKPAPSLPEPPQVAQGHQAQRQTPAHERRLGPRPPLQGPASSPRCRMMRRPCSCPQTTRPSSVWAGRAGPDACDAGTPLGFA
jgi:hypothetical protein